MAGIAVRHTLQQAWTRRGPLAWLLWPLSLLYRVAWRMRQWAYDTGLRPIHRVEVPVIVVGNVVAGGAGKTPIVIALVEHLQARGLRTGVVSRGYGRHATDCRLVTPASSARDVGDEPVLIQRRTGVPVAVAASRIQAARALLQAHPDLDVLICDDGLQHRALHRDIEICLFDQRGIGNGFVLPAGPLREPWPRPVDLVVSSATAPPGASAFRVSRSLADHALRADGSREALSALASETEVPAKPLLAVAGTADPAVFFAMLRARGLTLSRTVALPDHADFDAAQWRGVTGHTLLCTEKDAVKLWQYRPDALAVPLVLALEAPFWRSLEQMLSSRGTQRIRAKLSSGHGYTPSRPAGLPGHQGATGI
ncbi:MAG: tetraacyldisaccharide 4'-kinase [Burkholderiaceae bacterium]|nr:tetraacyldisaccharide 4'-kinase [Rhodoferax sp.]MCP5262651.1 tetraacyldisaccharide 4'-kinase [Rhodoferax sp.]